MTSTEVTPIHELLPASNKKAAPPLTPIIPPGAENAADHDARVLIMVGYKYRYQILLITIACITLLMMAVTKLPIHTGNVWANFAISSALASSVGLFAAYYISLWYIKKDLQKSWIPITVIVMSAEWSSTHVKAMKLDVKHVVASSVVFDRAAAHVSWWASMLGGAVIIISGLTTVLSTTIGAACTGDQSNGPGWCTGVTWCNAALGAVATTLAAWTAWWQPAQKAEKYDTASQDLQYEARLVDSKLGFAQRPPYEVAKMEFSNRYDRIVGRAGRLPGICFKGGSFEIQTDEMRQLPNFSCFESFMDLNNSATIAPATTTPDPAIQVVTEPVPVLPRTTTSTLSPADEALLARLTLQLERYDRIIDAK